MLPHLMFTEYKFFCGFIFCEHKYLRAKESQLYLAEHYRAPWRQPRATT
uniref:Uncharacterized protein n=1 Tax=Rhizophora mucronata TaxID=61149 RepID=A0A2P2NYQ5_RHIMU